MRKIVCAVLAGALALVMLAGPAAARSATNQRFKIVFVNTEEEATMVAVGPISGVGKIFFVSSEDRPDGSFVETYRAELPSGGFIFTVFGAPESFDLNPRTCVLRLVNSGTFTISEGTGAYSGVSGQGTFTFRLTQISQRTSEGCEEEGFFVGVGSSVAEATL
jgi:hypothetical protein